MPGLQPSDGYDATGVIVGTTLGRPARLGGTRLVCVDGPAGSGKTTLAARLAEQLTSRERSVAVVHMDDLYEGWTGVRTVEDRVEEWLLQPLGAGREGVYRRYDWHQAAYAEPHTVPRVDVLLLEGVASGCVRHADRTTLLVWVEAPPDLRMRRGLDRDGPELQEHWRRWMLDEDRFHEQDRTRARADLLVDGTTGLIVS